DLRDAARGTGRDVVGLALCDAGGDLVVGEPGDPAVAGRAHRDRPAGGGSIVPKSTFCRRLLALRLQKVDFGAGAALI
ncbi:hypothetical protein DKX15_18190, partial [Enterococcus faecium]